MVGETKDTMSGYNDRQWHLDKRVNVSVIITLLGYISITFIWAAKTDSRVEVLEQWIHRNQQITQELATIKAEQRFVNQQLEAINKKIDQIGGWGPGSLK